MNLKTQQVYIVLAVVGLVATTLEFCVENVEAGETSLFLSERRRKSKGIGIGAIPITIDKSLPGRKIIPKDQIRRRVPKKPSGSHHDSSGSGNEGEEYVGCLGYTSDELASKWNSDGDAPSCSYAHRSGQNGSGNGNNKKTQYDADKAAQQSYEESKEESNSTVTNDQENYDAGGGNNEDYYAAQGNDAEESNEDQYDPYDDFDISQCDTYENLWRWDLALTCAGDQTLDSSCQCTFASKLMDSGKLSCNDIQRCPKKCDICLTCLQLLDCFDGQDDFSNIKRSPKLIWIIVIVASFVALAAYASLCVYKVRKQHLERNRKNGYLGVHLMSSDQSSSSGSCRSSSPSPTTSPISTPPSSPVWLAPQIASHGDARKDPSSEKKSDKIWLAPIIPPSAAAQFVPNRSDDFIMDNHDIDVSTGKMNDIRLATDESNASDSDCTNKASLSSKQIEDKPAKDVWLAPDIELIVVDSVRAAREETNIIADSAMGQTSTTKPQSAASDIVVQASLEKDVWLAPVSTNSCDGADEDSESTTTSVWLAPDTTTTYADAAEAEPESCIETTDTENSKDKATYPASAMEQSDSDVTNLPIASTRNVLRALKTCTRDDQETSKATFPSETNTPQEQATVKSTTVTLQTVGTYPNDETETLCDISNDGKSGKYIPASDISESISRAQDTDCAEWSVEPADENSNANSVSNDINISLTDTDSTENAAEEEKSRN